LTAAIPLLPIKGFAASNLDQQKVMDGARNRFFACSLNTFHLVLSLVFSIERSIKIRDFLYSSFWLFFLLRRGFNGGKVLNLRKERDANGGLYMSDM